MSDETNPFAMRARARKAAAIAEALQASWQYVSLCVPEDASLIASVEAMTDEAWEHFAKAAGVNPPGPITRQMVLGILDSPALAGLKTKAAT